jgi:ring-1,2-phenylacetyl-CoA epoxidase subunit PaaE
MHFHSLQVKEVKKETSDCVSVAFEIPEASKADFSFVQGQNIAIKAIINGEELRRSYSICSSPLDGELRIAIKKVPNGRFSSFANTQLKKGDTLSVMPPTGSFFTPLNPAQQKHYVAFAAGSGITPILSLIKTTLATEPQSEFTLVYGNRNRSAIIFREQLEALKNKYMNRFRICYILSREKTDAPVNYGRIDAAKCEQLSGTLIHPASCDEFFICGPEAMIFSVRDWLLANGVAQPKIHFELFTVPGAAQNVVAQTASDLKQFDGKTSNVTVRLDGVSFDFTLPYNGDSVLDTALKEGADLPYACKGAVCCTCRAKLTEGKVHMDANYALSDDEIEQGYILTCQSHPRSEKIVVDFDVP